MNVSEDSTSHLQGTGEGVGEDTARFDRSAEAGDRSRKRGRTGQEVERKEAMEDQRPRKKPRKRKRTDTRKPAASAPPPAAPPAPEAPPTTTAVRESREFAPREGPTPSPPATATRRQTDEPEAPRITETLLRVEGLTKSFGGRTVVNGVSFTVQAGEVIGLLGKNGAGKTTTFRMTIGMIAPENGTIQFVNKDVTRLPMYRRARLGMGYLSQEPSVFRGLTVEQNLNAILELTPLSGRDRVRRRDELVEEFGLGRLLHSKAAVLSGGEKRRLEIARALIMEPSLILLDEPFSGVDPIAVEDIRQIILRLRGRGIGILLTDHNVRETLTTTDRSFIILDGRIIAHGNRDAILNDPNARKHYLGESFQM